MYERAKDVIRRVIFPTLCIGCILYSAAFFLPAWYMVRSSTDDHYMYGLFQTCLEGGSERLCTQSHVSSIDGDWVTVVQAFGSITLLCYFVAAALGFLVLCWNGKKKIHLCYASSVSACVTSVSLIITLLVFITNHTSVSGSYQYAFFIAIASLVILLLASALNIFMIFNGFIEKEKKTKRKNSRGKNTGLFISGQRMRDLTMIKPPMATHMKGSWNNDIPQYYRKESIGFHSIRKASTISSVGSCDVGSKTKASSRSDDVNTDTPYTPPTSTTLTGSTGITEDHISVDNARGYGNVSRASTIVTQNGPNYSNNVDSTPDISPPITRSSPSEKFDIIKPEEKYFCEKNNNLEEIPAVEVKSNGVIVSEGEFETAMATPSTSPKNEPNTDDVLDTNLDSKFTPHCMPPVNTKLSKDGSLHSFGRRESEFSRLKISFIFTQDENSKRQTNFVHEKRNHRRESDLYSKKRYAMYYRQQSLTRID